MFESISSFCFKTIPIEKICIRVSRSFEVLYLLNPFQIPNIFQVKSTLVHSDNFYTFGFKVKLRTVMVKVLIIRSSLPLCQQENMQNEGFDSKQTQSNSE